MPYVSIDLETTGLNPDTCQIIEIGAVYDDWTKPLDKLPVYHRYVVDAIYQGEPFALALNAKILQKLAEAPANIDTRIDEFILGCAVVDDLVNWLTVNCGFDAAHDKVTTTGKNFAKFDLPFLNRIGSFPFHHRVLDPGPLYYRPLEDVELPSTATCMQRAGMCGKVAHTAVEDAKAVVQLIRYAYSQRNSL
jgi:hypothetical protein